MVGGPWSYNPSTGKIVGDPFLQRQNEPSLALSSRNPCHILAGANDYRAVVNFSASAQDEVSGPLAVSCVPAAGTTFPLGTSTVGCSATDAAGNTAAASFTVSVVDTVAPVVNGFSFPAGFSPDSRYGASAITATLNVTDGSSLTVACSDSLGGTTTSPNGLSVTISGDGIHLVSCTVTDQGDNFTTTEPTTVKLGGAPRR